MVFKAKGRASPTSSGSSSLAYVVPPEARASPSFPVAHRRIEQPGAPAEAIAVSSRTVARRRAMADTARPRKMRAVSLAHRGLEAAARIVDRRRATIALASRTTCHVVTKASGGHGRDTRRLRVPGLRDAIPERTGRRAPCCALAGRRQERLSSRVEGRVADPLPVEPRGKVADLHHERRRLGPRPGHIG